MKERIINKHTLDRSDGWSRGDTPFCSDDCRREQIEMDRIRHRRKKQQALVAAQQQAAAAAMAQRDQRTQRQLQPQH